MTLTQASPEVNDPVVSSPAEKVPGSTAATLVRLPTNGLGDKKGHDDCAYLEASSDSAA